MKLQEVKPYHFNVDGIKMVEHMYKAKYLGPWCKKVKNGWSDVPVDVFYQPNPDLSQGHSHYFGLYLAADGGIFITDAASAFSEPINGILCPDETVIVSRYRHDYVVHGGFFIDGGRDYTRSGFPNKNELPRYVTVTVKDGNFEFTEQTS